MVATVYGTNFTIYKNIKASTGAGTFVGPTSWAGTTRYDSYTTDASEVSGSFIYLGVLKPGERFLGGQMIWPIIKTSGTIIFGDAGYTAAQALDQATAAAGDDDRYLASVSVAAASDGSTCQMVKQLGIGFQNASNIILELYATTGGATYAASKLIQCLIRVGIV